jgi:hypothetical protein
VNIFTNGEKSILFQKVILFVTQSVQHPELKTFYDLIAKATKIVHPPDVSKPNKSIKSGITV